jgi:predicted transcriptional regulator
MIARDIMTGSVCTIPPEASVQEVAQFLDRNHISSAPVLTHDGKLIGVVTQADIIGKVDREGLRVADIMSCEIYPVEEETGVDEIARLLTQRRIKRVPVLHEGKLVGIVCRTDIIHAVAEGYVIIRDW